MRLQVFSSFSSKRQASPLAENVTNCPRSYHAFPVEDFGQDRNDRPYLPA
jgi:hypothetical protein